MINEADSNQDSGKQKNYYSKNSDIQNSDILFIYDAKMCNPNGDPDDENKPRMDYTAKKNLVSDVRLKRYIRDYLQRLGYDIFVCKPEGQAVKPEERLKILISKYKKEKKIDLNNLKKEDLYRFLEKDKALIDIRLFGATIPLSSPVSFTGPIQFNWGYSLNKVELVESSTITSQFVGREKGRAEEYGTFGKDWRVYYSLIAFHGIISGKRAKETKLTDDDVKIFDEAMIKAIPQEATTRSKIGQTPRLYLRVEYTTDTFFLGDLRRYLKLTKSDGTEDDGKIRDISGVKIDVSNLVRLLEENASNIQNIYIWEHSDFKILSDQLNRSNILKDKIKVGVETESGK